MVIVALQSADSVNPCDYSFSEKNKKKDLKIFYVTLSSETKRHTGFYVLQNYVGREEINMGRVQMALQ
jgi:hypothetical protein